jgi:uncharacterized protein YegP (UPF0339 family)
MMERMDRCYQRLDEHSQEFHADVDFGQTAAQSVEKYHNKKDWLAAINAIKSSGSAPVRER